MLVYAAHLPHSPILVPAIGPERSRVLQRVRAALAEIASDIYERNIETIITVTPHGEGNGSHYLLQFAPRFEVSFRAFGDFATRAEVAGEPNLAAVIQHALGHRHPVQATTPQYMDSASAMAALSLSETGRRYRFLPITYRLADVSGLAAFGESLRDVVETAEAKIAVLSLGDLARAAGEAERPARAYDESLINAITGHEKVFNDADLAEADALRVVGFRPLAVLLGLLGTMRATADIVNYERAHGIGMMVARFSF